MAVAASSPPRVRVDGKFFRLGEKKFFVKGLAYGPLPPGVTGEPFASEEQTGRDFAQICALGANLIRVYHVPPRWWLDLALAHRLTVLVDVPWNQQVCFLDSARAQAEARAAVSAAVAACAGHPAVFGFCVANEIPPDIVRWSGARAAGAFIDDLVREAKRVDRGCLCTYANFPPTEFVEPRSVDFVCFNVYLHQQAALRKYLARLQMQAAAKPLLLGETGIDSLREGEARQSTLLGWQLEEAFRGGLAGAIVFGYTDDWWRNGQPVTDWSLGLTTRQRHPKDSFATVRRLFAVAPYFPLPRYPKVSVIVASFNAERTLRACLDSLANLRYPDYEIILVDDGSTDDTAQLARKQPKVRYLRHPRNLGLSAARNTGVAVAAGEIVAFTDADCRADEDWLYYLVGSLLDSEFAGMGGPNLLPPEDSLVAAAVMASPGGPTHVMLTDRQAEHIPGCNMAFYKWVLTGLGGFDPVFRRAGDDVDFCWRLQQAGYRLGFSPAAFVWHYRRSTVRDYLKQQRGYGEAEALLVRKHPEYFNLLGASIWRGRIYSPAHFGVRLRPPIIYRGQFGSAGFQFLYAAEPARALMFCTSLEYHVLVTVPLLVLSAVFPYLLPLPIASFLLSVGLCVVAGAQADLAPDKTRWWSRPLVATLFFLQPIVRAWPRYQHRLSLRSPPRSLRETLDSVALPDSRQRLDLAEYWAPQRFDRLAFVNALLQRLDRQQWPNKADAGWSAYDVEIYDTRWSRLQLTTAVEEHPGHGQLLRCRLRSRWSLKAKLAFWSLGGLELVILGDLGPRFHWLWLLVPALPLLAIFLRRQERNFQSLVLTLLDELAKEWNLVKLPRRALPETPSTPKTSPSSARAPTLCL